MFAWREYSVVFCLIQVVINLTRQV